MGAETGIPVGEESSIGTALSEIRTELAAVRRTLDEVRLLVGPFAAPFPDGSLLIQTLFGVKYFIDPSDDIMAPQLIVYRQWEAELSRFMASSVGKDTLFVDVGANFGYFTCLVASRIGREGTGSVIAVEPNPRMQALLERNTRINWSMSPITIHGCAVSNTAGYMQFEVPTGRAANAGFVRDGSPEHVGNHRFIVPTQTLSEIIGDRQVDLIKIDVEGYEALVLADMDRILARSPTVAVVMEWSPSQMAAAGFTVDDMATIFAANDLAAYRLPPSVSADVDTHDSLRLSVEDLRSLSYENILVRRRVGVPSAF